MPFSPFPPTPFEWRVATGRWRWLMLGALGISSSACRGQVRVKEETGGERNPGPTRTDTLTTSTTTAPTTFRPLPHPPGRAPGSECTNATPLGGGWERCENGLIHRPQPGGACPSRLPRPPQISDSELRAAYPNYDLLLDSVVCLLDSDCTARPQGHCELTDFSSDPLIPRVGPATYCRYGCSTDADCGKYSVCVCGELTGICVSSSCRTDADCPAGMCASYVSSPGCQHAALACQTEQDECVVDADCAGLTCTVDDFPGGTQRRFCSPPNAVCGRPFLIEGDARRADAVARADWYPVLGLMGGPPAVAAGAELRARLAQGWLDQALMEHASVAAFARFALQLLQLGAPAELVNETSQALADEIAHARDCFALARRYSDRDRGPAPLPLGGARGTLELTEIVLGAIAEGCIGETVAALEAAEALAHCLDAAARAALERISADETRHAQLAWRFVAWALESGPENLRWHVAAAFERELAGAPAGGAILLSANEHELLLYGLVGPELRRALRTRVLHDVVAPCARALLSDTGKLPQPPVPLYASRRSTLEIELAQR